MTAIRRVLVANELASYRESIAAVFRIALPRVEVLLRLRPLRGEQVNLHDLLSAVGRTVVRIA